MSNSEFNLGHTIVNGVMSHGGTCSRIVLYENDVAKVKLYVDIGREIVTDPKTGLRIYQAADIAADLANSDGIVLSHAHADHITGLPTMVDSIRRRGGKVPPIYCETFTHEILKHEFALHGISMQGLHIEHVEPEKPFSLGPQDGPKLKVIPVASSHSMPTLGFIFQSETKTPITMIWESDIKNDPTSMLRPGHSIDRILELAGDGPIHNLAISAHRFSRAGHNTKDRAIADMLCRVVAGYQNVVFVSYGGSPDHSALIASVTANAGKSALIYTGRTHDIYLQALKKTGYDVAKSALQILGAKEAEAFGIPTTDRFVLCDTGEGDLRGIVRGDAESPTVPFGPKTLFIFFDRLRGENLKAEIGQKGCAVFEIPILSTHAHGIDILQRIEAYNPLSVTPLHAQRIAQGQFVDAMYERGMICSTSLPGEEYIITDKGQPFAPIKRQYGRVDLLESCLVTDKKQAPLAAEQGVGDLRRFSRGADIAIGVKEFAL